MEGAIFKQIAAVQADINFIDKAKTTQSGAKFKYRGVDQVLNTLHPLFAKHNVFAVPEVLDVLSREVRKTNNGNEVLYQVLKVKYTFYAEDGSSVSATVVGEAMDSGDKASNKCMSVAYKYACFQILSIPTEETTQDPDDDNQHFAEKNQPRENPNPLTRNELTNLGVTDFEAFKAFVKENYGKTVLELSKEESDELRAWLKGKAEARRRKEAQARGETAEEPLPWEEE